MFTCCVLALLEVLSVHCPIWWFPAALSIKAGFLSMFSSARSSPVLSTCTVASFMTISFAFCASAHFFQICKCALFSVPPSFLTCRALCLNLLSPHFVLLVTNSCLPFQPGFRSSLGPYLPRTPVRLKNRDSVFLLTLSFLSK